MGSVHTSFLPSFTSILFVLYLFLLLLLIRLVSVHMEIIWLRSVASRPQSIDGTDMGIKPNLKGIFSWYKCLLKFQGFCLYLLNFAMSWLIFLIVCSLLLIFALSSFGLCWWSLILQLHDWCVLNRAIKCIFEHDAPSVLDFICVSVVRLETKLLMLDLREGPANKLEFKKSYSFDMLA